MSDFFQPSYPLWLFILVKQFAWFQALALLSLMRLIVAQRLARLFAGLSLVAALVALIVLFAPALGFGEAPWYGPGIQVLRHGDGLSAALVASLPLIVSGLVPGKRWLWIDLAHFVMIVGLVGLWFTTLL